MALRFAGLSVALLACQAQPPPDRVRLELSEIVTNRAAVRPTLRVHRGNQSSNAAAGSYALRAEPAGIAVVNADGTLACAKSGDAKITADVAGVTSTGTLRCRLVDRIEVAEVGALDMTKGPVALSVRVLSKDGSELSDVPISVVSTNQAPVRVKGVEVTPVAVGTTDLVVHAGGAERRFALRVVRSVVVSPKPLYGGKRVDLDVPPGKYEIEVTLRDAREFRIDWRGARQCAYRASGVTHRSTCQLADKGAAVVDNPSFVEDGELGIVKQRFVVREVP
jgi:hypothetical protein